MKDIENKSTEELAKRLIDLRREEQAIMIELWKRCPSPKEDIKKIRR